MSQKNITKAQLLQNLQEVEKSCEALRTEKAQLQSLFNNAPLPYQSLDSNGLILDVNQAFLDAIGYQRQEIIGQNFIRLLSPGCVTLFAELFEQFKAGGTIKNAGLDLVRKDGSLISVHYNGQISRDGNGNLRMHCLFNNITAKTAADSLVAKQQQQSEMFLKAALDGFILADDKGRILDVNPSYCKMTGYSPEELKKRNIRDVEVKIPREKIQRRIERIVKKGWDRFKTQHKAKDGRIIDLDVSIVVIKGEQKPLVAAFVRDITDYKKAINSLAQSEIKLRNVIEHSPVGISLADEQGIIVEWNPSLEEMMGIEAREALGHPVWEVHLLFLPEEQRTKSALDSQRKAIKGMLKTGQVPDRFVSREQPYCHPNGAIRSHLRTFFTIKTEKGHMLSTVTHDITERKRAEKSLQESEEKYRLLAETIQDAILLIDTKGTVLYINKRGLELSGFDEAQAIGMSIVNFIPAEHQMGITGRLKKRIDGDASTFHYQTEIFNKAGDRIPLDVQTTPVLRNGRISELLVVARDISEQKRAENQLLESKRALSATLDGLSVNIALLDEKGEILLVNKAWRDFAAENSALPEAVSEGINYLEICRSATASGDSWATSFAQGIKNVLAGTLDSYVQEYPCHSPDKKRWNMGRVTRFPGSGPSRVVVAHEDITERKEFEIFLRDSEERFRKSFQNNPSVMMLVDFETRTIIDVNQAYINKLGYSSEEVCNKPNNLGLRLLNKNDIETMSRRIADSDRLEGFETILITKSGQKLNMLAFAEPLDIEGGHFHIVTAFDVTDRKKAEEQLIENEQRLSRLMGNLPGMVYRCKMDKSWEMLFVNEGCLNLTGYKDLELVGNAVISYNELIHPDDRDYVWQKVKYAVKHHTTFTLTYRIQPKTGSIKYVWEQGLPVYDDHGRVRHLEGFIADITERVASEKQLMESEERFRSVLENIQLIGVMIDPDGRLTFANDYFLSLTGYKRTEALGLNWFDTFLLKKGRDELWQVFKSISRDKLFPASYQNPIRTKSGKVRLVRWSNTVHFDTDDRFLFVTSIGEDITEQAEYVKQLNKTTEHLRALAHHLETIREEERSHIAREIHDEFGQVLTVLKINLSFLQEELAELPQSDPLNQVINELHSMKELIDSSVKNLRKLVMALRPEELEKLGLFMTVSNLVNEFQQKTAIDCTFRFRLEEAVIDNQQALVIYRIMQELLTNVARHARASKVSITARTVKSTHRIQISDNGAGFDLDKVSNITSFGLLGIKERAHIYGGDVSISSKPGSGTTVKVSIPVMQDQTIVKEEQTQ